MSPNIMLSPENIPCLLKSVTTAKWHKCLTYTKNAHVLKEET
ncbi:hypothetical protein SBF1_6430003 [Candidatus Desulfosporosinus infrequens]|uniref:Uncharacterized protein n=1 Tax=Candidatus Desulfosporosinus infrequens TaxID=2043169 RepID=A0A2U3LMP0_9FIRM|nr:hypothetical protein SBF1_6430003 [Candidatus Desulfosporosinus infrequens]